jgi:ubiquinone/menaquinone biosynthesis C-methylase UbiE
MTDITKMQARLKAALKNPRVCEMVRQDLMHTFMNLGLHAGAAAAVNRIFTAINACKDLLFVEQAMNRYFQSICVNNVRVIDILDEKMRERAQLVYSQISQFLDKNGLIVDIGCGDGQVTNLIHNHITHNVVGYDVRRYTAQGIAALIKQYDGTRIPASNGYFDIGIMTNVAHHEADNAKLLKELARIIKPGGRLVVIETVPVEDKPEEFERTFFGDYVYNRLFHHGADVPVPGTYETEEGWVRRFAEVGFSLEKLNGIANPTPLGYDQPTIRDWHTRLVLRRNN